ELRLALVAGEAAGHGGVALGVGLEQGLDRARGALARRARWHLVEPIDQEQEVAAPQQALAEAPVRAHLAARELAANEREQVAVGALELAQRHEDGQRAVRKPDRGRAVPRDREQHALELRRLARAGFAEEHEPAPLVLARAAEGLGQRQ